MYHKILLVVIRLFIYDYDDVLLSKEVICHRPIRCLVELVSEIKLSAGDQPLTHLTIDLLHECSSA